MKLNKQLQNLLYHWPAKVISLILALAIYLFIQYSTVGSRVVTIPLDVLLPTGYEATSLVPDSVEIEIRGDGKIIYLIDPTSITARSDFSSVDEGGISTAPVLLVYEQNIFEQGAVSLTPNPREFRILFTQEAEGDG